MNSGFWLITSKTDSSSADGRRKTVVDTDRLKIGFKEFSFTTERRKVKIIEVQNRTPNLIGQLLTVWEHSVRATHLFLSDNEINNIKGYVPQALNGVAHLMIAEDETGRPVAFMGIENGTLEMLFISPEERGKGLGKRLVQYGIKNYAVEKLAVNEQNPQAKGFYEHMGFQTYKRTDLDEQGNPYPLLYMSLSQNPLENIYK